MKIKQFLKTPTIKNPSHRPILIIIMIIMVVVNIGTGHHITMVHLVFQVPQLRVRQILPMGTPGVRQEQILQETQLLRENLDLRLQHLVLFSELVDPLDGLLRLELCLGAGLLDGKIVPLAPLLVLFAVFVEGALALGLFAAAPAERVGGTVGGEVLHLAFGVAGSHRWSFFGLLGRVGRRRPALYEVGEVLK